MRIRKSASRSASINPRGFLGLGFCLFAVVLAMLGVGLSPSHAALAQASAPKAQQNPAMVVHSIHNDISPPLRDMLIPYPHGDGADPIIQELLGNPLPSFLSDPILNFSGIPYSGVIPPDPSGAAGATQYVQMVNLRYQVFDKSTGNSVLGPAPIRSIWSGFGGACETNGGFNPIVLYDQLANRWVITQQTGFPAHQCIAVSMTSDATGSYNRYDFILGSNCFFTPRLSVWPDAYYMSIKVSNSACTTYLGPQPFAFDRAAMLAGVPSTFITTGITGGPSESTFLPAHLDGSTLPPAGAPNIFVEWPGGSNANNYKIWHFHVDFGNPANSTFTQFGPLMPAAPFTRICSSACVPQLPPGDNLEAHDDSLMLRLAYRNFGTHESLIGNYTVNSGGVAGIRWFELRNVTAGPVTKFQESTYQPDTTWRWMGSAAMDGSGNLAIGFSASSSSIFPQVRYAGRRVNDPLNTLTAERTLYAGTGIQFASAAWGDFSCLVIDPVDDSTFWYTNEYYDTSSSYNWRTRIGSFRLQPGVNLISGGSTIVSAGPNGVLDPGETVEVRLGIQNAGDPGFCTTAALTGTLQPTGGVTNPMPSSQNYGAICPGDPVVFRNFVFTVDPALACGGIVTASLHLTDGAIDYGLRTYTFNMGTPSLGFSENFDGVTPPALPAGWVATNAQGPPPLWVTSNVSPDTPPNDAFVQSVGVFSDKRLDTPRILVSANAQLSFRNNYDFDGGEIGPDGAVLEVSSPNINGGTFTDIVDAAVGGSFLTGGYNFTIPTGVGSPIEGRLAWTGRSNGYINTVVNLGSNVAGQTINLRFRLGTTNNGVSETWRIDTISVSNRACAPAAQSALSRKTHGAAGTFDVPLPLAGNVGIECRNGPTHQMIINFVAPVTVSSASVTLGTGTVSSFSVNGSQVTVNLAGVTNAQRITVTLFNVNDGANMGDVSVSMGVLAGDVNSNGVVNASDVSLTKSQVGQLVSGSNFRGDVNANGSISATDVALVKSNLGTGLP